jgi:hypothetical protein
MIFIEKQGLEKVLRSWKAAGSNLPHFAYISEHFPPTSFLQVLTCPFYLLVLVVSRLKGC